ncbi:putative Polycomb group protein ASXL2 [Hyperolius riggenbachi]|uniref:putative Polycomb group protein ASXL2 n=1 Tax=Hyperolius riggenbachi TaxID=752182 RepID=UPI0035A28F12
MPHNTARDAARRKRRKRRKKKKGRTWAEAARTVLEKYHNTPMSHKEILQVIQREGLKEISGTSPLACLNAMLHTNSRGEEGMFYKVPGRMGVYTLKKDVADVVKELSDCSEDSSEAQSDSQGSEHSTSTSSSTSATSSKDRRRSCWKRKVTSRVSQPSSPQTSCPSPPIPAGKVISPSQKLSKKALKQALKQQQQRKKLQRRAGMPVPSSQHLLLKTVKTASNMAPAKPTSTHTWAAKRSEAPPRTQQISAPASTLAAKSSEALDRLGKKALQRSSRLRDRHLKRTKCAEIDVETPESILVNTNLRALINKHTFSLLPADCQQTLLRLLPEVDRPAGPDGILKLNSSALNNEFFTSASQSWKERLAEGEFTPEMQLRIRQEIEKEKKVETWKEKFYESYYGENSGVSMEEFSEMMTEDGDHRDTITLSEDRTTPTPTEKVAKASNKMSREDHPVVKKEEHNSPKKPQVVEVTEAISHPEKTDTGAAVKTEPVKKTEAIVEKKADSHAVDKSKIKTMASPACEAKTAEPTSHIYTSPSKPKSPTLVQSPQTPASREDTPRDSSEAETPETSPEKVEANLTSGAKRRLDVGEESLSSPEKSPRLAGPSHSPQPFRALCKPRTEAAQQTPDQKVPPLKIPLSWISPKPFLSSQVSHRPTFPSANTSPGRTGARTLADIKAKAQLARAKRAAEAAAHAGSIPGPGPGGGGGPGGGPKSQSDETRKRLLDLGNTGSGRGERGTATPQPASQPQGEVKAAAQIPAHGAARAQLLQKPGVQPRIPTTPTGPPRLPLSQTSENRNLNTEFVTPDKAMQFPGVSGLGFRAQCAESNNVDGTQGVFAHESKTPFTAPSAGPLSSPGARTGSSTMDSSSVKLKMSVSTQVNDTTTWQQLTDARVRPQTLVSPSGQPMRSSSSIPANNPLVTQLLQGKKVPLEQILPKPLTKVEMKTVPLTSAERSHSTSMGPALQASDSCRRENVENMSHSAAQQLERFLSHNRQHPSGQRIWQLFSGTDLSSSGSNPLQGSVATTANQEQILQSLIKKVWQENSANSSNTSEFNNGVPQRENVSQRFMLGFVGRRVSKPAMSGHYLLNLSTYGRVPEAFKRIPVGIIDAESSLNDPYRLDLVDDETESVTESGEEDSESEESASECANPAIRVEFGPQLSLPLKSETVSNKSTKTEQFPQLDLKETFQAVARGNIYNDANIARDLAKMANVFGVRLKHNSSEMFGTHGASVESQHYQPEMMQPGRTYGNPASLLGSSYGGTINISASDGLHRSSIPTAGDFTSSNADNVVSFSVTVTTIPSSHGMNSSCPDQPISVQAFTDDSTMELSPSRCYCRLKAMIVCKGCGAFCHDDCIGPSKLCVSCLVVR